MAVDPFLLEILVCPETKAAVRMAAPDVLKAINAAIDKGSVLNKGGERVTEKLEAALVRADDEVVYPVREDVPIMLVAKQIALKPLLGR